MLCIIASSIKARGYSPTFREIAERIGLRSMAGVCQHVNRLERAGLITRGIAVRGASWRSIKLTPEGEELIGLRDPLAAEQAIEALGFGA